MAPRDEQERKNSPGEPGEAATACDCPMVLLRHVLPDDSWHYDWMLARTPSEPDVPDRSAGLLSFRLMDRPDAPGATLLHVELLGDHRWAYLEHEGPITGGRGRVERIGAGRCRIVSQMPDSIEFIASFDSLPRRWRGHPQGQPPKWVLRLV